MGSSPLRDALTIPILGVLHRLDAATVRDITDEIDRLTLSARDRVGGTLRRMERDGLVVRESVGFRVGDLWRLTDAGEVLRTQLIKALAAENGTNEETAPRVNGALSRQATQV